MLVILHMNHDIFANGLSLSSPPAPPQGDSKRAAETARNVQTTNKATQHKREKLEEGGKQQQGRSCR